MYCAHSLAIAATSRGGAAEQAPSTKRQGIARRRMCIGIDRSREEAERVSWAMGERREGLDGLRDTAEAAAASPGSDPQGPAFRRLPDRALSCSGSER